MTFQLMPSIHQYFARTPRVLPGFGISLGFTVFYLTLIVLIPLGTLCIANTSLSPRAFWDIISDARLIASYKLTFNSAFIAAFLNSIFGLILSWVLVRYHFPGKKFIDAIVDLPFALPTAVAGIALTALYSPTGWLGRSLESLGIKIAFSPSGIIMALIFIGFPFVVRTIQPVLQDLDKEAEEAAACLGANRWQIFTKIIFPHLFPAFLTGFALAFARGLGEYGSVIFIAGNIPYVSEIVPLLIIIKLEQYDYQGATAIATVMLVISFCLLFIINWLQKWSRSFES